MVNQVEQACWNCRYSYPCQEDTYRCPWASERKGVYKWDRNKDGFILKCPKFVEDGYWKPSDWNWEGKGIRYSDQIGQSTRIVCLEERIMFSRIIDVIDWLKFIGKRKSKKHPTKFSSAVSKGVKRFRSYGFTWEFVENNPLHGQKRYLGGEKS